MKKGITGEGEYQNAGPQGVAVGPAPADIKDVNIEATIPTSEVSDYQKKQAERLALQQKDAEELQSQVNGLYDIYGDELTKEQITPFVNTRNLWNYQSTYGNKQGRTGTFFLAPEWSENGIADVTYDEMMRRARQNKDDRERAAARESEQDKVLAQLANGQNFTTSNRTAIEDAVRNGDYEALRSALQTHVGDINVAEGGSLYESINDILQPDLEGYPDNATPEQKAEIDARNLEKQRRATALSQVVHNAGLGYDPTTGKYSVPEKQATIDEVYRQRQKAKMDEEIKYRQQQQAIDRANNRTAFADLAAGIGDIIKGSQGSPVTPRDYTNLYKTLDARGQRAYEARLAREQYERELERQRAKLEQERQDAFDKIRLKGEEDRKTQAQKHADDMEKQENKNKAELVKFYVGKGMSKDEAEKKADEEIKKTEKYEGIIRLGTSTYGATKNSGEGQASAIPQRIYSHIAEYVKNNPTLKKIWNDNTVRKQSGVLSEDDAVATINRFFAAMEANPNVNVADIDHMQEYLKKNYNLISSDEQSAPTVVATQAAAAPAAATGTKVEKKSSGDGGMFD